MEVIHMLQSSLELATECMEYHLNSENEETYKKIQMEALYNGEIMFDNKILKSPKSAING
jgi:hypothetical protein